MALILKENENLITSNGTEYLNSYAVIDRLNINKKTKVVDFYLDVYKDIASRQENKKTILDYRFTVNGDVFDNYFSLSQVEENENEYRCAYEFCKNYVPQNIAGNALFPITYDRNWNCNFNKDIWQADEEV